MTVFGPSRGWQRVQHGLDLVRLHREDDDVLRAGEGVVVGGVHVARDLFAPIGADEFDAVFADRLQVAAPHKKGDVLAGQGEFRADQAADGPGADDCDLHEWSLPWSC